LNDGESKKLLQSAEIFFEKENFVETLINCRKAIYVEIENDYEISHFKDADTSIPAFGLMMYGYKAPYWAKNKQYIEENVTEPTGYIVYDHSSLEMDLVKNGVSTSTFWNIYRLTPSVFRQEKDSEWVVKNKFRCFEKEGIKDRAEYVLTAAVELILSLHQSKNQTKSPEYHLYYIDLTQTEVPIYSKASKNSKIVRHTPEGLTQLETDFNVTGLDSQDTYWHVSNFEDSIFFSGFIHENYVKSSKGNKPVAPDRRGRAA